MVVDSCKDSGSDKAVALEYLENLGVDVASQVKLVVVTHWHDDHIRGAAQILRYAESAKFVCSAALDCNEFITLVSAHDGIKLIVPSSGVSEFAEILKILSSRNRGKYVPGPEIWAHENTCIYYEKAPHRVTVNTLSPSSQTITDSKIHIGRLIPSYGQPRGRIPSQSPNILSVVLLVSTKGHNLLLGADLEKGRSPRHGWQAVLNPSVQTPIGRSSVYKVAHHGSERADLNGIWEDLLRSQPHALIAPKAGGRKPLPSDADIARIKERTSRLFCTAWPPTKKPRRRDSAVDRTIKEVVHSIKSLRKRSGHIRWRAPMDGSATPASIEFFDGAKEL